MAVTQFEPGVFHAGTNLFLRHATFNTVGNVPSELTALSNMSISEETMDGDFKTVSFEESPLMTTYLVAVVGFFDYIEETTSDGNAHLFKA
ncbi:aminopeptidase M1 [Tanacetum coccineum]